MEENEKQHEQMQDEAKNSEKKGGSIKSDQGRNLICISLLCLYFIGLCTFLEVRNLQNKEYRNGVYYAEKAIRVVDMVETVYEANEISYAEYKNFINVCIEISEHLYDDSGIPREVIEAYNKAVDTFYFLDDTYVITDKKWVLQGFQDGIKWFQYQNIMKELYREGRISGVTYNAYKNVTDQAYHYEYIQENIKSSIAYAEMIIQRVEGDDLGKQILRLDGRNYETLYSKG